MNVVHAIDAARSAVTAHADRPATAILYDSPDVRLVVFRIEPGQAVAPHRSTSAVTLQVLEGSGSLSGESNDTTAAHNVAVGDLVTYVPNELHGMRAADAQLLLLATITPRPETR